MTISELTPATRKVDVEAKVVEKEQPREVNTRYGQTKVTNVVIEDESGVITLVLWGDQADQVNEGDKIQVQNGYVTEWNGKLQLNVGKYGKLTVVN